MVEVDDRRFELIMGRDVDRDGMYLEMSDADTGIMVAEVFYSDETGRMTLTLFEADLPLGAIEKLIERSKIRLPQVIVGT